MRHSSFLRFLGPCPVSFTLSCFKKSNLTDCIGVDSGQSINVTVNDRNGSIFDDQATVILLILSGCFEFFRWQVCIVIGGYFHCLIFMRLSKWFVTPTETLNTPAL